MEISQLVENIEIPDTINWKGFQLDEPAFKILIILQFNPTITVSQLADELPYSTTLINSRISLMKEQKLLRPDRQIFVPFLGKRVLTEVEAIYRPEVLGLSRINIFLTGFDTQHQLKYTRQLLEIHPYSHYHVTVFGAETAVFCQFDIPGEGIPLLNQLFDRLIHEGYFKSKYSIDQDLVFRNDLDIANLLKSSISWTIDNILENQQNDDLSEIDYLWNDFIASHTATKQIKENSKGSDNEKVKIDEIDLQLIKELTINSKLNISKLAKNYDISRSRISRRIKRLRESVISEERLIINLDAFNLTYSQLMTGTFSKEYSINQELFANFIDSTQLPFQSQLIIRENSFIWLIIGRPVSIPEISRFVSFNFDDVKIYQLDLKSSRTHYFPSNNYDDENGWKLDHDYIIDIPLKSMKELDANESV